MEYFDESQFSAIPNQQCIRKGDVKRNAIKRNRIKDGAVDSSKIAEGAITGAKIADGTITVDDLAPEVLGSNANQLAALLEGLLVCPPGAPTRFVDNGDGTICDHQTERM